MITEEFFSSFVYQASLNPETLRIDAYSNFYSEDNCNNHYFDSAATQQQQRRHGPNLSPLTRAKFSVSSCSPLDYPELLIAYRKFSYNTLLRYHYNVPFLQPRAAYSISRRLSSASIGQGRMRPHTRYASSFAAPVADHFSPSRAYGHHEETVSPSAEVAYHSGVRRPDVITTAMGERARGSWNGAPAEHAEYDDCVMTASERFSSLSPRQLRYRHTSSSSNGRPRAGSGVSFEALNQAGFAYDDDDKNNGDYYVNGDDGTEKVIEEHPSVFTGGPGAEMGLTTSSFILPHPQPASHHHHHHYHHNHHLNSNIFRQHTTGQFEAVLVGGSVSGSSERRNGEEEEAYELWAPDADEAFFDSRSALPSVLRGEDDV